MPLSTDGTFTKQVIASAFESLNGELRAMNRKAVLGLCGGAVMTLVHEARISTEDIDAWIDDPAIVGEMSERVGRTLGLPRNWLNDAVREFLPDWSHKWITWAEYSHLTVWVAKPDVMLVMKLQAARHRDVSDIRFLMKFLKLEGDLEKLWSLYTLYYGRDLELDKKLLLADLLRSGQ